MVVGCHVLRSVRTHFLLPGRPVLSFSKNNIRYERALPRRRIHRVIEASIRDIWAGGGGGEGEGVGWNDFQIKRKIKGRLVKFRNSWRVHRVPGFRISGGEAKR